MAHFSSEDLNERFTKKVHVEKIKSILTNFSVTEEDFENSYLAAEYTNAGSSPDFLLQKLYEEFLE